MGRNWPGKSLLVSMFIFSGCASVQPLSQVASRARMPQGLGREVVVDTTSRADAHGLQRLAWIGYSVSLECASHCPVSKADRQTIANQVGSETFRSFDEKLRLSLARTGGAGEQNSIELLSASDSVANPAFAQELKLDSFASRIGRWFEKLKLHHDETVTASAAGLKTLDPSEIGWSGETSLQKLGQALGVDGVLVARVQVSLNEDGRYEISGPRLWVFSTRRAASIASAQLRTRWSSDLESSGSTNTLRLDGFDVVAKAYSERVSQELKTL